MNNESFPEGYKELLDEVEATLQAENQRVLEAQFQDDLNTFRARVVQKLLGHGALSRGNGWAIFRVDDLSDEADVMATGLYKEVLIYSGVSSDTTTGAIKRGGSPFLRIITNELVPFQEGIVWLTEDFVADNDGDTQYYMDVLNPEPSEEYKEQEEKSKSPIFLVNAEGLLGISPNSPKYPPVVEITHNTKKGAPSEILTSVPFGIFINLEDKIHALNMGKAILDQIEQLEPVYKAQTA